VARERGGPELVGGMGGKGRSGGTPFGGCLSEIQRNLKLRLTMADRRLGNINGEYIGHVSVGLG